MVTAGLDTGIHECPRCGWRDALPPREAAGYLRERGYVVSTRGPGLSAETIRNYVEAGELPGAVRAPGPGGWRWLVPIRSLDALLARRGEGGG